MAIKRKRPVRVTPLKGAARTGYRAPQTAHGVVARHSSQQLKGAKVVTHLQAAEALVEATRHLDLDKEIDEDYKTKVPKGKTVVPTQVDGRSARARLFRDTYQTIVEDLGGDSVTSTAQKEVARRLAGIAVIAIELEQTLLGTEGKLKSPVIDEYLKLARATESVARTLGLSMQRQSKDVTPKTLDNYEYEGESVS